MILVFIWIQWSWKWTQARILQEKYDFNISETWTALREIALKDSDLWKLVKKTIESWNQVTPNIVEDILKDVISSNSKPHLILDWYVRNAWNKLSVDKIVWDYKAIFFDLPEDEAKNRLLWRMYDPKTWETFPSEATINPKNWNTLVKRADDEENAINTRIKLFFEKTMPIVELYKKENKLIVIDAKQSVWDVAKEIEKKLNLI